VAALVLGAMSADAADPKKPQGSGKAPPKQEKVVPSDPDNIKGISPYELLLADGRKHASQQNWSAAAVAFEKAIAQKPDEARGYLLLAQAKRDGDVFEILEQGQTKKATEAVQSKFLFVRAELLERRASLTPTTTTGADLGELLKTVWDRSIQAWTAYAAFVVAHTRAPDHRATADARRQAIARSQELEQQFASVRAKRDNK
jgi:hypothetical protein